jgi:hypothetical protein
MSEDTGLTPAENAFFESGGETALEETASEATETTETVAEETTAEAKPEVKAEETPKQEKTVPLAALHQARMENRETRAKMEKMEQAFQALLAKANAPQIPDFETDPAGHLAIKQQLLEQSVQQQAQQTQAQLRAQQEHAEEQRLRAQYSQIEADFAKNAPDYYEAAGYLNQHIQNHFLEQGYTQQEAEQHTFAQLKHWLVTTANAGMNPAQFAYETAKAQGYKAKQQITPAQKIETINKGQQARSLSGTPGKGNGGLTLEALADMDPDELDANWHKLKDLM